MRDSQLPGYVAWTHALLGQLNDSRAYIVGQWATVHKHTPELVDTAVAFISRNTKELRDSVFFCLKLRHLPNLA